MSENISFQFIVVDFGSNYLEEDLRRIKVEYAHHELGQMKLTFEELIQLVTLDECGKGLSTVAIYLVFIDMKQVECYVIGVRFKGCRKEADVKLNLGALQELKRQPKSLGSDAHEDDLAWIQEFLILF